MKLYVKVLGVLIAVVLVAAAILLLSNGPVPKHPDLQVNVDLTVSVQVLDLVNNTPVPGSTVYFMACCPNNTSFREVYMDNLTGEDGWALFVTNYTLDKDQVIYMGASNRKALVESDFTGKNFNGSGYLGEWKSFNYSVLYNSDDNKATISCTITVDLDTGAMI